MRRGLLLLGVLAILGWAQWIVRQSVAADTAPWSVSTVGRQEHARAAAEDKSEDKPGKYLHIGMDFNIPTAERKMDKFRVTDERGQEVGELWGWNQSQSTLIFEGQWDSLDGLYLDGLNHRVPLFSRMGTRPRPVEPATSEPATAAATREPAVVTREPEVIVPEPSTEGVTINEGDLGDRYIVRNRRAVDRVVIHRDGRDQVVLYEYGTDRWLLDEMGRRIRAYRGVDGSHVYTDADGNAVAEPDVGPAPGLGAGPGAGPALGAGPGSGAGEGAGAGAGAGPGPGAGSGSGAGPGAGGGGAGGGSGGGGGFGYGGGGGPGGGWRRIGRWR